MFLLIKNRCNDRPFPNHRSVSGQGPPDRRFLSAFRVRTALRRHLFLYPWRAWRKYARHRIKMSDIPYSSIIVSGPDSFAFLQAQLTIDLQSLTKNTAIRSGRSGQVNHVASSDSIRSAWCNPKGRAICMPYFTENTDGYFLTIPTELVDLRMPRMTLFRFPPTA